MTPHEEKFIRAFVHRDYRQRYMAKGRVIRDHLWHELPCRLDSRSAVELPKNVRTPNQILQVLHALTSSKTATCLSAMSELDGQEVQLNALEDWEGTIVSVIPGELAYYQSEVCSDTVRCLLVAKSSLRARAKTLLGACAAERRPRKLSGKGRPAR